MKRMDESVTYWDHDGFIFDFWVASTLLRLFLFTLRFFRLMELELIGAKGMRDCKMEEQSGLGWWSYRKFSPNDYYKMSEEMWSRNCAYQSQRLVFNTDEPLGTRSCLKILFFEVFLILVTDLFDSPHPIGLTFFSCWESLAPTFYFGYFYDVGPQDQRAPWYE